MTKELKMAAAADTHSNVPGDFQPVSLSAPEIEAWLCSELAVKLRLRESALNVNAPITRYGLDSLTATEVAHSLEEKSGLHVPMEALLDGASIRELAASLQSRTDPGAVPTSRLRPPSPAGEEFEEHPLSRGQQALWHLYRVTPLTAAYNLSAALRFRPALEAARLGRSMQALVERHAALRTVFAATPEGVVQRIWREAAAGFRAEDASTWDNDRLNERLLDAAHLPFDLEKGPLFRVSLFERSSQECILLLVIHHIVSDLWSLTTLLRELIVLYQAGTTGNTARLDPAAFEYSDFVRWQEELLAGAEGSRHWEYWQEQLRGELPKLNLPADRPRPSAQSYSGGSQSCTLDRELSEGLKRLSQECGSTLYVVLLALFHALLYRYTDQRDLIVGSPILGRNRFEWAGVLGYFVNPVPLRARVEDTLSFRAFVGQVRQTVLGALEHQDYPFSLMVERLQPPRDASRSPVFDALFVFQKPPLVEDQDVTPFALGLAGATMAFGELTIESIALDRKAAQFDLTVMMGEVRDRLGVSVRYSTALFDRSTIDQMLRHLQTLAGAIVANPDVPVSALQILTEVERTQLLLQSAGPATDFGGGECVTQLIEEQLRRHPAATAVVYEGEGLTCAQLEQRANALAHSLRSLGVKPEVGVALCMERSVDLIVAILGIMKAGGYYVPLDPGEPQDRLAMMLEEARPAVLLTQERLLERLANLGCYKLCIDSEASRMVEMNDAVPPGAVDGANLAYVIFTSGSTGRPRGVAVEHRQLLNYVRAIQERLDFPEGASFATVSTIAADLGNTMVFPALCMGGCLHVISHDRSLDPGALGEYCARHAIDCLKIVASHLQILLKSANPGEILPRRRLVLGGEAFPWELADTLQALAPECTIFNHYGPSETTVGVLTHNVREAANDRGSATVPLGRPLANVHAYVLDRHLQPSPPRVPGELYLGGRCVTRGYLGHPDLTAAKFIPDPLSGVAGSRLYKTGDMARYLNDGTIEFLGRMDNQVKIRGFRIELEEIEGLLAQHPSVRQVAVLAVESDTAGKRLTAYLVPGADGDPRARELRRFLKQKAPEHMIPATFLALDEFPVTLNGKVDRKALLSQAVRNLADTEAEEVGTPLEEALANMCARTLETDRVGIHDNFFELGGHSLMATQMISQLQEIFPSETPLLAMFFENPTAAALAAAILEGRDSEEEAARAARIVETLEQYCRQ